jgi:4-amino-4-deoxy-L-arabinose transferase-like glycosyltransferase
MDEFLHVPVLLPSLRSTTLYYLQFGQLTVPLMVMSYVGALKGWLLRFWFLLVPMGVPGYRLLGITAGWITLLLTWRFTRRFWGRPVSLMLVALLATDPSFVHTTRLDYGPVALMQLLKMGALCLLVRDSRRALAGGFFLLGLGVWDKANFVWFLAGLSLTSVLLFPRELYARRRWLPLAAASFLLGASPFLAFNWSQRAQTWQERGRFEIRWFKLLQAEGTLNGDFMTALTGEPELDSSPPAQDVVLPALANAMYGLGKFRKTILVPLLGLAVLLLPLHLILGPRRRLLFPLLVSLFTYACMFVTFDGGSSVHHVIMVYPFPLLFLAASLWTPVALRPQLRLVPLALLAAALLVNLSLNARHLAIYTRTGGTGGFSDASYRLLPLLAQHRDRQLYALDWGFSNPVAFLGAAHNLLVDDIFFSLNNPGSPDHPREVARLRELMAVPGNIFLLHSPQRTLFPAPTSAFVSLRREGLPVRQLAVFHERTGQAIYEVWESGSPGSRPESVQPVEVRFFPPEARRSQAYVIQVQEFANQWIDLVYHVDQSAAGTATRFCRLDGTGRATMTVPPDHPLATVSIAQIRPSDGQWRPASGSIRIIE